MFKLPKLKMPKVKMPDMVGKAKDLTKKVGDGVKSSAKGATKGIKSLNPFKKQYNKYPCMNSWIFWLLVIGVSAYLGIYVW